MCYELDFYANCDINLTIVIHDCFHKRVHGGWP